ncbi:MAG: SUMF1/EgtB/PvdO family nonheme iron enzyme, partial [Sphaerospermopsis kisseleviana]
LRLQNSDARVRIAALQQALNYGEQGLDLVIAGLNNESWDVQNAAYLLLRNRTETKVKQALISNIQGVKLEKIEVVTVNNFGEIIQRQQRIARYFTEDLGNGVTLEMAAIPGGTFLMGSPEDEKGRYPSESPQHEVTVPDFFMGKYPVTQAQYQAIVGNNPSYFKGENRPVETVSWDDAVTFCQHLSQRTEKNYTLPSEAQWEYACRAGTTTPFYFGESITSDLVNYNGDYTYAAEPKGKWRRQTTDVGTFPPNTFGLYDMHGNVLEWCLDDFVTNYNKAPTDGSAVTSSSYRKILRGGSWDYDDANRCRSANRYHYSRVNRKNDAAMGFRVVIISSV